jgi:hypothetical protein
MSYCLSSGARLYETIAYLAVDDDDHQFHHASVHVRTACPNSGVLGCLTMAGTAASTQGSQAACCGCCSQLSTSGRTCDMWASSDWELSKWLKGRLQWDIMLSHVKVLVTVRFLQARNHQGADSVKRKSRAVCEQTWPTACRAQQHWIASVWQQPTSGAFIHPAADRSKPNLESVSP